MERPANMPHMEAPDKVIYINLFEDITPPKVKVIMSACSDILVKEKPGTLYFCFSSPGGDVNAGITLYSFLRGLPVQVVMHNTGAIDSVATVIYLAGDVRKACPHATFLFHGVQIGIGQSVALNLQRLRELVSQVEQDQQKIARVLTARSKLEAAEVQQLFNVGESKPPEFALQKDIVHVIEDLDIPRNAMLLSFNLA